MFPEQNVHYIKNFSIGYPGVNFVKATEYNGKYAYDASKAILSLERNSPRYRRRTISLAQPQGYNLQNNKTEPNPNYPVSLNSIDNRAPANYPESVPPLDEAPPSASLDRQVNQLLLEERQRQEEQAAKYNEMQLPPAEMPIEPQQPQYEKPIEMPPEPQDPAPQIHNLDEFVKRQEPASLRGAKSERVLDNKKPTMLSYKEELDRQIQSKQQYKKNQADYNKQRDVEMVKNWQAEQEQFAKVKADESKKLREATRDYYDHQIEEKGRLQNSRHSRKIEQKPPIPVEPQYEYSEPISAPHQEAKMPEIQKEPEPQINPVLENRRKIVEQMEKLEKEKERVRQELMSKDVQVSKSVADPTAFLQDVNRERFKQVF